MDKKTRILIGTVIALAAFVTGIGTAVYFVGQNNVGGRVLDTSQQQTAETTSAPTAAPDEAPVNEAPAQPTQHPEQARTEPEPVQQTDAAAQGGKNLVDGMSRDDRYLLNIFLSNFSELAMTELDTASASDDVLIYFACMHNAINRTSGTITIPEEELAKYVTIDEFAFSPTKISVQTINNTLDRYLGRGVKHKSVSGYFGIGGDEFAYSNGYYYFEAGEIDGDASLYVTVADSMHENGDGTYTVEFSNYLTEYDSSKSYYYLSPSDALASSKMRKVTTGRAIVRPHVYNGKNTYRLVKWQSESQY